MATLAKHPSSTHAPMPHPATSPSDFEPASWLSQKPFRSSFSHPYLLEATFEVFVIIGLAAALAAATFFIGS
ncbi:MAG: hypothetical protein KC476_10680 [Cyanobacteria bacterium HKST-UBA06]|nr:hypothetical protein [Cyanobacteria bacterium HKST-UBA06]